MCHMTLLVSMFHDLRILLTLPNISHTFFLLHSRWIFEVLLLLFTPLLYIRHLCPENYFRKAQKWSHLNLILIHLSQCVIKMIWNHYKQKSEFILSYAELLLLAPSGRTLLNFNTIWMQLRSSHTRLKIRYAIKFRCSRMEYQWCCCHDVIPSTDPHMSQRFHPHPNQSAV